MSNIESKDSSNVLISFVVPVYGAEDYLEECIHSLFHSTKYNVEVIAINDGSPDNSDKILKKLQNIYLNLNVVNQENIGGAETINKGLKIAQGKYVSIVDNDDFILPGIIDSLIVKLEKFDAEFISTPVIKYWNDNKKEIAYDTKYITEEIVVNLASNKNILNDGFYLGKVFKSSFLKKYSISMEPSLLYADRPFVNIASVYAKKIILIPSKFYFWRQRENPNNLSLTDQESDLKLIGDRINSIRILKLELQSRGFGYYLNTVDYYNAHRLFWGFKNRNYFYLKGFAKKCRPYFNELTIKLDTTGNLTPTQKFLVSSIKKYPDWLFPLLYYKRIWFHKIKVLKDRFLGAILRLNGKLFNYHYFDRSVSNYSKYETTDELLVFFESNFGKSYSGQPKYIYEELLRQNRRFRAVWVYQGKKLEKIPGNVIQVHRGSSDYYKLLARSKFWVNNIRFTVSFKPRGTIYLNTWHGTPLKKLGLDIEVSGPEASARDHFLKESSQWDYLLAQNEFSAKKLTKAFAMKGDVLAYGYPANDLFFRKDLAQVVTKIKTELGIKQGKKVILYAPTWRDDSRKSDKWEFSFELLMDLKEMQNQLGDDFILLLRMHHLVRDEFDLSSVSNFVIDVSDYDDVTELMAITDILITDYSSIFFDFMTLKKPILFYMYDLEKYQSKIRGFYLDVRKDLPGPVVENFDSLMDELFSLKNDFDQKKYNYDKLFNLYCSCDDGSASKRVVNQVFSSLPYKT